MTATGTVPSVSATRPARGGGRPRDPQLDGRIAAAVAHLLANDGPHGFTVDDIARCCQVGKASIYRRWRSQGDVLAAAVRELGVRDVDWGPGPGILRDDLVVLLLTATTGETARAELALLSMLPHSEALTRAYLAGPEKRLGDAIAEAQARAAARAQTFPRPMRIYAALNLIRHDILVYGARPSALSVGGIVDAVILCD